MKLKLFLLSILAIIFFVAYQKYLELSTNSNLYPGSTSQIASTTTNWKNYLNEENGFTFKYPEDFYLEVLKYDDNSSFIIFLDKEPISLATTNSHNRIGRINIQVARLGMNDSYCSSEKYLSLPTEKITLDQLDSKISEEITTATDSRTSMRDVHYFSNTFIKDGYRYIFSIQDKNLTFEASKNIYDQILASFKFTN